VTPFSSEKAASFVRHSLGKIEENNSITSSRLSGNFGTSIFNNNRLNLATIENTINKSSKDVGSGGS